MQFTNDNTRLFIGDNYGDLYEYYMEDFYSLSEKYTFLLGVVVNINKRGQIQNGKSKVQNSQPLLNFTKHYTFDNHVLKLITDYL